MTIEHTLSERGKHYSGDYRDLSATSQALKRTMRSAANWPLLPPDVRESLDMIQVKVARILNGNWDYEDHAVDIIGYATLMLDGIKGRNKLTCSNHVEGS